MPCPNAVSPYEVKRRFETLAARDYVGQQQSWNYVGGALESYTGLAPRASCADWTLHFSGPSGSGKSFLAELVSNAAFEPWEDEQYSLAQLGLVTSAGAVCGLIGGIFGPVGIGAGSAACALGANKVWQVAQGMSTTMQRTFRAPRPYPSQCGVVQHKFSRGSSVAEVRAWEHRVAESLLRDPATIVVVDDIGRLRDAEAFEHFGRLLCGVGGNSIPEFHTGSADGTLVPASGALFILTSDLELDEADAPISCEVGAFDEMIDTVREQSARFWLERQLHMPDWWATLPLVPFRELCAEELSYVSQRYLKRQCEHAGKQLEAHLERGSSWALGAQRVYRWTGTAKHGASSYNVLDAYVSDTTASAKMRRAARKGGWVIADFHSHVMRPALQALTAPHEHGADGSLIATGSRRVETSYFNYTTVTYTSEVCLTVAARESGALPRARFELMRHMCY